MCYHWSSIDNQQCQEGLYQIGLKRNKHHQTKIHNREYLEQHTRADFVLIVIQAEMYHTCNGKQRNKTQGKISARLTTCQSANGPNSSKASKCGTISNALPENTP